MQPNSDQRFTCRDKKQRPQLTGDCGHINLELLKSPLHPPPSTFHPPPNRLCIIRMVRLSVISSDFIPDVVNPRYFRYWVPTKTPAHQGFQEYTLEYISEL
ncbi:hypothetical protein PoB_005762300 [Plakobranchus ocellatus]|uniref:Uncharacterized protein n=1 Tax=Plakobranchus ocellatus TaxID=259542 RepID=A0AAV4CGQ0_9GAST|nr:hypothetical protein PoB_005762300 [Plakobranchus ocellatus]